VGGWRRNMTGRTEQLVKIYLTRLKNRECGSTRLLTRASSSPLVVRCRRRRPLYVLSHSKYVRSGLRIVERHFSAAWVKLLSSHGCQCGISAVTCLGRSKVLSDLTNRASSVGQYQWYMYLDTKSIQYRISWYIYSAVSVLVDRW